jgi:exoribonuclease-2
MNSPQSSHFDLQAAAKQIMLENGFEPDFPPEVQQQLAQIKTQQLQAVTGEVRDLRHLLWSSIDNDTSRDLDQIEAAEKLPDGTTKIMVGIADVDALVAKDTPIDRHAARETTTVYTGVRNFPMLPETLCTGTTSLLEVDSKLSVITEFFVGKDGVVGKHQIYRALVTNKAQLTYNAVGAWLEGRGPAPAKVAASAELQAQLKLQDEVAQALKNERHRHGALNIETTEVHPVVLNAQVVDLQKQEKNRATELIEDFMIAANGVVARTLEEARISSIRRVVKIPERWEKPVCRCGTGTDRLELHQ